MVERLGEMRKGRRVRIEKGRREGIEKEIKSTSDQHMKWSKAHTS